MTTKKQVRKASRLIGELVPILRRLNKEDIDPNHRKELRDLTGDGAMFELSKLANALSSETAFQSYRDSNTKKRRSKTKQGGGR